VFEIYSRQPRKTSRTCKTWLVRTGISHRRVTHLIIMTTRCQALSSTGRSYKAAGLRGCLSTQIGAGGTSPKLLGPVLAPKKSTALSLSLSLSLSSKLQRRPLIVITLVPSVESLSIISTGKSSLVASQAYDVYHEQRTITNLRRVRGKAPNPATWHVRPDHQASKCSS
jgi:hypothetical protein